MKYRLRGVAGPMPADRVEVEQFGDESRRRSGEIDALDAAGNLRLGRFGEFQLVENVAGALCSCSDRTGR